MKTHIVGWDIGGAHLKAAVINPLHEVVAVYQYPCPLWQGLDKLHAAVGTVTRQLPDGNVQHALTMTGELADLFSGRADGVRQILTAMTMCLGRTDIVAYAGQQGLLRLSEITPEHYSAIASANWLASATLAAQKTSCGLFVDIGSTTTDILVFAKGKVMAEGYTDYQRLISQELIYTGVVRTPVMAVAHTAQNEGKEVGLMAEYFATMADVYRLTQELHEIHDQHETADGAAKTIPASAKRLARMVGCDYCDVDLQRWRQLAFNLRNQQVNRIQQACARQLQRINAQENAILVGAGIGRFLVQEIAQSLAVPCLDFSDFFSGLTGPTEYGVSDCAPAVAVACLLAKI